MHIELDPPTGITGFRFGVSAEQVRQAAAAIGEVTVMDDSVAKKWTHMKVSVVHPQFRIFFNLEDGKTLTSVEILRPQPGPEEISVTWRGIDVFATRADDFFDRVDYFPTVPGLTLGMSRDPAGDDEFPMDEETGYADYFLRVLAAPAEYYDPLLTDPELRRS